MITKKNSGLWRGIAILIVIASHYAGSMYVEPVRPALKDAVSSLGPYGVDIFFLLSGYGLTKSANRSGVGLSFIVKRVMTIYVPYILMATGIELYTGGFDDIDLDGVIKLLTGYGYWYMNVLFMLYIAFMIAWQWRGKLRFFRIPTMLGATVAIMSYLSNLGRADFWIISDAAFMIGIIAAAFDERLDGRKWRYILFVAMVAVGIYGFWLSMSNIAYLKLLYVEEIMGWQIAANVSLSIAILALCYLTPDFGWVLPFIGKNSMYIYIMHMILFWQLTFKFDMFNYFLSTAIVCVISILVSVAIGSLYGKITDLIRISFRKKLKENKTA